MASEQKPPTGTKENPKPPMPHPLPGKDVAGRPPTLLSAMVDHAPSEPDQEARERLASKELPIPPPPPPLAPVRPALPPGLNTIDDPEREQAILHLQAHIADFKAILNAFAYEVEGEFGARIKFLKENL